MPMPSKVPLNTYGPTAGRAHMKGKPPRPKALTVDLHNHMRIRAADEIVKPYLKKDDNIALSLADAKSAEIYRKQHADRAMAWTDVPTRLADMDKMDLDVMAISCLPTQFFYGVETSVGVESRQAINDGISAAVKTNPDRFVGLGTLPMQDTDKALKELDRCVNTLGFRGIQIGAKVEKEELSAERFEPLWARCQELDVPIFIHPSSFVSDRFGRFHLANTIGNPLDTTVAVHYLIFDGVMARYPKIKFYLSHGGAFAAAYGARMDHAFGARLDCREKIDELPSTYLKRFYVDTIVFSVDQLDYLIKKFGADHVALGTDYPADIGEYDPVEHVYQVEGLSETDREKICGLNALRLMNLDAGRFGRKAASAAGSGRPGPPIVLLN
jgi:aminocarboxymuconate-semialdehyde decarboxylase